MEKICQAAPAMARFCFWGTHNSRTAHTVQHRSRWSHTASRHERGYGTAWDKLRLRILSRDLYLCQHCLTLGRPTQATDVDHITPKAKGGTDDDANLQALCRTCHDTKTAMDKGHTPRRRIGQDGWPVE